MSGNKIIGLAIGVILAVIFTQSAYYAGYARGWDDCEEHYGVGDNEY